MSSNEAGFDLRETRPLPRNMLHSWKMRSLADTGQRTNLKVPSCPTGYRGWLHYSTSPKVSTGYLNYPADVRDTAKSGIGHNDNRHLNDLAESTFVNVGGLCRNVKASSLPMIGISVGGVIVLGARESLAHGEGRQFVGISNAKVTECQHEGGSSCECR